MKITVRTFGNFREMIGAREREHSLAAGESVAGLLKSLCAAHPALRREIYDRAGNLQPYILILKNGRNIASLRQLDTLLAEQDVIALFPPVGGG